MRRLICLSIVAVCVPAIADPDNALESQILNKSHSAPWKLSYTSAESGKKGFPISHSFGRWLAGRNGCLYDLLSHAFLVPSGRRSDIAVSPNEDLAAVGTDTATPHITLLRLPNGEVVREITFGEFFEGSGKVASVAFTPNGRFLVAVHKSGKGLAYDVTADKVVDQFKIDTGPYRLVFSSDSRRVLFDHDHLQRAIQYLNLPQPTDGAPSALIPKTLIQSSPGVFSDLSFSGRYLLVGRKVSYLPFRPVDNHIQLIEDPNAWAMGGQVYDLEAKDKPLVNDYAIPSLYTVVDSRVLDSGPRAPRVVGIGGWTSVPDLSLEKDFPLVFIIDTTNVRELLPGNARFSAISEGLAKEGVACWDKLNLAITLGMTTREAINKHNYKNFLPHLYYPELRQTAMVVTHDEKLLITGDNAGYVAFFDLASRSSALLLRAKGPYRPKPESPPSEWFGKYQGDFSIKSLELSQDEKFLFVDYGTSGEIFDLTKIKRTYGF